jgi:hypothetical protein
MGKKFRRLIAQALAADQAEMRALIERILPRGEGGKRVLRLESDADRKTAPLAIAAAVSADAITGDEAEELKRQAENPSDEAKTKRPWWEDPPPGFQRLTPEERRQAGYVRPPEEHPLADAIRAWGEAARSCGTKGTALAVPGDRVEMDRSRCRAAGEGRTIVNINENTMAAADGDAAGPGGQKTDPL